MKYIKGFDSLRAFSIIFVILTHLGLKAELPQYEYVLTRVWGLFSGGTGVNIFFTLSGFLITSILISEKVRNGKISLKNFYIRRFLRLLPPLIIFFVAVLLLMKQGLIQDSGVGLLLSIFYVYNYAPNMYYTAELGHTWSLALEEQFYILWPFVINFVRDYKRIMLIIYSVVVLSWVFICIYPDVFMFKNYRPGRWFIPAIATVLVGSYFAILNEIYKVRWAEKFKNNRKLLLLSGLLFVFVLYAPTPVLPFVASVQSVGVSLFLIWIMYNQSSMLVLALENKPLSYIGKISYGLYVYQGLFLRTGPGSDFWLQQFPLNIVLTVATAIVSYHAFEKPILKLKGRFR